MLARNSTPSYSRMSVSPSTRWLALIDDDHLSARRAARISPQQVFCFALGDRKKQTELARVSFHPDQLIVAESLTESAGSREVFDSPEGHANSWPQERAVLLEDISIDAVAAIEQHVLAVDHGRSETGTASDAIYGTRDGEITDGTDAAFINFPYGLDFRDSHIVSGCEQGQME
jgi:hypothetical protein